jgi:hypothetical protein
MGCTGVLVTFLYCTTSPDQVKTSQDLCVTSLGSKLVRTSFSTMHNQAELVYYSLVWFFSRF